MFSESIDADIVSIIHGKIEQDSNSLLTNSNE
jgi:hypothetical protein